MAEKIQIPASDKQFLAGLHRKPPENSARNLEDTLVIMAHGFPGHKTGNNDLYGDLEFLLADKGLHTLRFDFRGCGESDGREEDFTLAGACEDFQQVLFWAKEKEYKRLAFIGEGLGATLAVMNAALNVRVMVLLWPAFDLKSYGQNVFGLDKLKEEDQKKKYIEHENHKIGLNLVKELGSTPLHYALHEVFMPTLIMHGAHDKIIPVEQLDLARSHIRAKRVEITTFHDGEHKLQKLNHRKMMFYHITQFIEKYT